MGLQELHEPVNGLGTVPGQAAGFPERFECPLGDNVRRQLGASGGLLASGDVFIDSSGWKVSMRAAAPSAAFTLPMPHLHTVTGCPPRSPV